MSEGPVAASPLLKALYKVALRGYYYSGAAALHLGLGRGQRTCTILLYHGVSDAPDRDEELFDGRFVTTAAFRRQMRFLVRHFDVMSLREAVDQVESGTPFRRRSAVVTFDDGYRNNFDVAHPVLREFGVPATYFVATDFIGGVRRPWWDRVQEMVHPSRRLGTVKVTVDSGDRSFDLSTVPARRRLYLDVMRAVQSRPSEEQSIMGGLERSLGAPERASDGNGFVDWDELRAVASEPLVEVGGHSGSHAHLSSLSQEDARVEVLGSKQTLENALGVSVTSFAYPYGTQASYTEETVEILKEAGFSCGLTGVEGKVDCRTDRFQLRRVSVLENDRWPDFVAKVLGASATLRRAWARRRHA
jgi:peptidoglycan/xylan/chitin deacetylase (PgdA/CDA1 family)